MVKVKNGYPSDAKKTKPKPYASHLATLTHKGVMFFVSPSSRLESGAHLTLLTAIARQCTLHRSVLTARQLDEASGKKLLKRWVKSLPVDKIC